MFESSWIFVGVKFGFTLNAGPEPDTPHFIGSNRLDEGLTESGLWGLSRAGSGYLPYKIPQSQDPNDPQNLNPKP